MAINYQACIEQIKVQRLGNSHCPSLPSWDCLFIESMDEIFSEIDDSLDDLKVVLLQNINKRIGECQRNHFPFFISYDSNNINWERLNHAFDSDAPIIQALSAHIQFEGTYYEKRKRFFQQCIQLGCKNLLIGGVYGDGCVWETSIKFGNNIYSQILPAFFSPNLRIPWTPERFENIIIDPQITEGCHDRFENRCFMGQYFMFPDTFNLSQLLTTNYDIEHADSYMSGFEKHLPFYEQQVHKVIQSHNNLNVSNNNHKAFSFFSFNDRLDCSYSEQKIKPQSAEDNELVLSNKKIKLEQDNQPPSPRRS